MKTSLLAVGAASALVLGLVLTPAGTTQAQGADEMEEVIVTGSRIRRNPLDSPVAIMEIGAADIENTGQTNLADALQQLPISGSAINSQFNVPGNSGFPQDGSGIGAGESAFDFKLLGVHANHASLGADLERLGNGELWRKRMELVGDQFDCDVSRVYDAKLRRAAQVR